VRCWLLLAAYQGLRCQENAGLKREDVLYELDLLRVVHGKGGKQRLIPLHPEVRRATMALPILPCDRLWEPLGGGGRTLLLCRPTCCLLGATWATTPAEARDHSPRTAASDM